MKTKKYTGSKEKPKNNFKTMINKELNTLNSEIGSPIQKISNKP